MLQQMSPSRPHQNCNFLIILFFVCLFVSPPFLSLSEACSEANLLGATPVPCRSRVFPPLFVLLRRSRTHRLPVKFSGGSGGRRGSCQPQHPANCSSPGAAVTIETAANAQALLGGPQRDAQPHARAGREPNQTGLHQKTPPKPCQRARRRLTAEAELPGASPGGSQGSG